MHSERLKFHDHIIIHSSHFVSTGGAQRLQAQSFSLYSKLLVTLQINLYMLTNTTVHIPITIHMFLSFHYLFLNLIIVNPIKCINIQFFIIKLYKYTEIKKRIVNWPSSFVYSACFSPTWLSISSLIMFLISFLISVPN